MGLGVGYKNRWNCGKGYLTRKVFRNVIWKPTAIEIPGNRYAKINWSDRVIEGHLPPPRHCVLTNKSRFKNGLSLSKVLVNGVP